jgi:hypothetical protein
LEFRTAFNAVRRALMTAALKNQQTGTEFA